MKLIHRGVIKDISESLEIPTIPMVILFALLYIRSLGKKQAESVNLHNLQQYFHDNYHKLVGYSMDRDKKAIRVYTGKPGEEFTLSWDKRGILQMVHKYTYDDLGITTYLCSNYFDLR